VYSQLSARTTNHGGLVVGVEKNVSYSSGSPFASQVWIPVITGIAGDSLTTKQSKYMLKQTIFTAISVGLISAGGLHAADQPHVMAKSPVEAGKYLTMVAGCNDCHTPGWLFAPGTIPEAAWFTGSNIGWNGPWGTSYAPNLRRSVAKYTEQQFTQLIKSGTLKPPMPAENLKGMSDDDFKAIYAYIKSLGLAGEDVPQALPPDIVPPAPYINMMPVGMAPPPHPGGHKGAMPPKKTGN